MLINKYYCLFWRNLFLSLIRKYKHLYF